MSNLVERIKDIRKKYTFFNCEDCGDKKPLTRKGKKYCSTKCKFRAWAKLHPRVYKGDI